MSEFSLVLKGNLLNWLYMNVMWLGENECVWWIKMEVMINV